jgi:type VI protein secretion system component VasK
MLRYGRLLLALLGGHAGLLKDHATNRAMHLGLLAVFGLTAFVFILVLATIGLTEWLGLVPALALMAGIWLFSCLVVFLMMQAEQRKHQAAMQAQLQEEKRVAQTALLAALPAVRRSGIVTAGLAGVVLALMMGRGKRD